MLVPHNELMEVDRRIDRMTFDAWRNETQLGARPATAAVAFRRILVATDGAPPSEAALAWAAAVGGALRAHVTVITVTPQRGALEAYDAAALEYYPHEEQRGKEVLDDAVARLAKAGIEPEPLLVSGNPASEVVRAAADGDADLVIVGTHGYGPVARLLLGSVADAAMSRAPASVLIARSPPPSKRLLLTTDGSLASRRAIAAGLLLRKAWDAQAKVLHVVSFPVLGEPEHGRAGYERVLKGLDLAPSEEDKLAFDVQYGKPAERIVETARREGHDLIVVGHRGLGAVQAVLDRSEMVPGSVSKRVAHEAQASVLLVRGPLEGAPGPES